MFLLYLANIPTNWLAKFTQQVTEMPEVIEFFRLAGDVDYMLRVVVTDIAQFDEFYKRLIAIAPLQKVTSHFAMEKIKSTTALPLNIAGDKVKKQKKSLRIFAQLFY